VHKRRLRAPSPAFVISLIALFVALGGTSYAAIHLPKNSVGSKQLKKNAVTSAKIKNHAVSAAKINTTGLTVPSATHATNADSATSATNATELGGKPDSFYAPQTLQSGQSESGTYAVAAGNSTSGFANEGIAFPHPLAAALDGSHVAFLNGTTTTNCPGVGQAAAGYLCVYASAVSNLGPDNGRFVNTHAGQGGADAYGFMVFFDVTAASAYSYGSWTVTAP
jgi:hypothetical protein